VRIAAVLAPFAAVYVTPTGAAALVGTHATLALLLHASVLPFHSHTVNLLRGGIFATVAWFCAASAFLSAAGVAGSVPVQWALVACAPGALAVGAALVQARRVGVRGAIQRLRAEYAAELVADAPRRGSSAYQGGRLSGRAKRKRDPLAEFYEVDTR
jgi:hypothetical protein